MREQYIAIGGDADDDVIAEDVFDGDWRQDAGRVVVECIDALRHLAGGDGMDRLTERPEVFVAIGFVVKRIAVLPDQNPVDGEALRDGGAAAESNDGAAMDARIRRAAPRQPFTVVERRMKNGNGSADDRHLDSFDYRL